MNRFLCLVVVIALLTLGKAGAQTDFGTQMVSETYRLGFMGHAQVGLGLIVDSVTPNGPATRMVSRDGRNTVGILETGDVITAVDGVRVQTMDEYSRLMDNSRRSSGRVTLSILDTNTGRTFDWLAQGDLVHVSNRPNPNPPNMNLWVYRLQFRGTEVPGGIRIDGFTPNGPFTRLTPHGFTGIAAAEIGDVITSINGVRIVSFAQYHQLMEQARASGGIVTLTLRDVRTGNESAFEAQAVLVNSALDLIPNPVANRRIHILICGLTNDTSIGQAITQSVGSLQGVLQGNIARELVGSFRTITGSECNATSILQAVDLMQVGPDDTIFCYYLGHGAYDQSQAFGDPTGGHFFQIPSGDLMRRTLFDRVRNKNARLTVLITDTCNVASIARPKTETRQRTLQMTVEGFTKLEKLLLFYRGEVDISASSRDEFSWFTASSGGWFTQNLCHLISKHDDWNAFLADLSQRSNAFFQQSKQQILSMPGQSSPQVLDSLRGQLAMRPQAFRFAVDRDPYLANSLAGRRTLTEEATTQVFVP